MAEDHLQNVTECPDCASQNIVHGMMRDQIICRDCGLIFEPLAPAAAKPVARRTRPVKPARAAKKGKAKKAVRKKAKPARKKKPAKKKFGWW